MTTWEKKVLPDVSSRYGAPLGRCALWPANRNAPIKMHLCRMRLVDGDYDAGGAYWGAPMWNRPDERLWVAWGYDLESSEECMVRVIRRAESRSRAKDKIREDLPNARFYR